MPAGATVAARRSRGRAAARGDGGGIGRSGQGAGAAAVSRSALLSSSPILPAMAAPPCRRAGGRDRRGQCSSVLRELGSTSA